MCDTESYNTPQFLLQHGNRFTIEPPMSLLCFFLLYGCIGNVLKTILGSFENIFEETLGYSGIHLGHVEYSFGHFWNAFWEGIFWTHKYYKVHF